MKEFRRVKSLGTVLLILLLWNSAAFSQTAAPGISLRQRLQARLDEFHRGGSFAGATLGVCLPDGKCFGLATGFSDSETKTPMKPDDLMPAGSVGKTYAAAAALQLAERGKINLDDKIETYLGKEAWFPRLPNSKDITIRQLMNHTSGLVRYEFKDEFARDLTANPDKVWKPVELIAYVFDTKAPFEAGQGWEYSDTNYIVLGVIMEKATGRKFYDLTENGIIRPLKLAHTIRQDRRSIKGMIQGYAGDNNPYGRRDAVLENGRFIINPQFEWTGGGFVTSAEDLARWAKALYEGKVFSRSLLPQVLDGVPAPVLGKDTKYGLGAIIRPTSVGISYGHRGFFPGYRTDMMYFPERKFAVALQVNTSVSKNLGKPFTEVLVGMAEEIAKGN